MVVPIFSPNDLEMTKYSPPPSTRRLVASSLSASAVGMVTVWPINMTRITPQKPICPTAIPKRRKRMAPSMVDMAVKKTGSVPNPFVFIPAI